MGLLLMIFVRLVQLHLTGAVNNPIVNTTSGSIIGLVEETTPKVAQFLGIPFAEPPIGARRWLPPIPKSREESVNATKFGPACSQFNYDSPSIFQTDAPEHNVPENSSSEDCLSVNIWAPWSNNNGGLTGQLLPVIVWIYGGAFQTGGANVKYYSSSPWVERSQKHIVVAINHRLNIFGFPNAAGLKDGEQNLGLLDQRLALEWIRSNIKEFGGDPARIVLWGQSSGAMSIDHYNFAYPDDPIVSGMILNSGVSLINLDSNDVKHTNFTFVATHFGCSNLSASAEIDCMRNVSAADILAFLKAVDNGVASGGPSVAFSTIIDERTKFSNYTERALLGNFTKVPAIIGTTVNEGEVFMPYDKENGPNKTEADAITLSYFLCPAVKTTQNRYAAGATTFRFLYGGNFSNIAPQWWEGAYHGAELPLVFGTHGIARGASTALEVAVSEKMQDYWVAFAEDPVHGLPGQGWNAYNPEGNGVLFGWNNIAAQPITEAKLEEACDGELPIAGARPPPW